MDLLKDTMIFINLGTIKTMPNTGLVKVPVLCSAETFVVKIATFAKRRKLVAMLTHQTTLP
jgi:hypothetical protein